MSLVSEARTHHALAARAELAEGPVWDAGRGVLWWVDIVRGEIHAFDPERASDRAWSVGQSVGAVALTGGDRLVAACASGFAEFDPATGALLPIADPEPHLPANRFNDGKCDPAGRFWAGTMARDAATCRGSLYCLDVDRTIARKLERVTISNGLAWSPAGDTLYFIDTATGCVRAFDYDVDTAAIGRERVVVDVPASAGAPDGMTIDAEGTLWVALWGGSAIARWDPASGRELARVAIPARNVTSCTFGGDGYRRLYVTTAAADRPAHCPTDLGGDLFVVEVDVPGMPPARYAG